VESEAMMECVVEWAVEIGVAGFLVISLLTLGLAVVLAYMHAREHGRR
jgi:hypothetical protein